MSNYALGKQNKHIAKQLKISEWTVSTHLRRIFAKLGVASRAAMVYRCSSLIHGNLNSVDIQQFS
jgi:DNA-binding NarL/FixJ family response regulator